MDALRKPLAGQGMQVVGTFSIYQLFVCETREDLRSYLEIVEFHVNIWVRGVEQCIWKDYSPFEYQDCFDDTGDSTAGFDVPYIGFNGAANGLISTCHPISRVIQPVHLHVKWLFRGATCSKNPADRLGFCRVPHNSACT